MHRHSALGTFIHTVHVHPYCAHTHAAQMENQVIVSDYSQMDRILREERQYILNICKKIKKAGCNVLFIQKSILRYICVYACICVCACVSLVCTRQVYIGRGGDFLPLQCNMRMTVEAVSGWIQNCIYSRSIPFVPRPFSTRSVQLIK